MRLADSGDGSVAKQLDYDAGADVLYLHFDEKPSSNHSEMREDGIVLDYRDDQLVGLTVLEASCR